MAENKVALDASVDNLDDDLLVGEADDETVFRCIAIEKVMRILPKCILNS